MQWTEIDRWTQQSTAPAPATGAEPGELKSAVISASWISRISEALRRRRPSALPQAVVTHVTQAIGGSDLHLARALHALDPAVMLACGRPRRRRKTKTQSRR